MINLDNMLDVLREAWDSSIETKEIRLILNVMKNLFPGMSAEDAVSVLRYRIKVVFTGSTHYKLIREQDHDD